MQSRDVPRSFINRAIYRHAEAISSKIAVYAGLFMESDALSRREERNVISPIGV